ncbi:MAG: hypothetical protein H0V93_06890 [Euzebyales bacterium]|jgi:hypothetical protein|nr:hypothetical protein [Euzebyales bacterium]
MTEGDWYWCLAHERPEQGTGCRADNRLGPYESREAAVNWKARHEARAERWKAEDRAWDRD